MTVQNETDKEQDAMHDSAFDIALLAVDTNIPALSTEHDNYVYGIPKRGPDGQK